MFINDRSVAMPVAKRLSWDINDPNHTNPWHNGVYESYRLRTALLGVRLRPPYAQRRINWFAVDRYGDTVRQFKAVLAVSRPGTTVADYFVLPPEGVFNVGVAARQQGHSQLLPGGAFQFQYVAEAGSAAPQLVETARRLTAFSKLFQ